MKKTKKITVEIDELELFVCDKCGKKLSPKEDFMELQETTSIHFTGGYGSVFGDEIEVVCDLCQECLKELIGDFCVRQPKYEIESKIIPESSDEESRDRFEKRASRGSTEEGLSLLDKLEEQREKLKSGTAEWHSYDETFDLKPPEGYGFWLDYAISTMDVRTLNVISELHEETGWWGRAVAREEIIEAATSELHRLRKGQVNLRVKEELKLLKYVSARVKETTRETSETRERLNKTMAEADTFSRFQRRSDRGSVEEGLRLLDKIEDWNALNYKGYLARVEFDAKDHIFVGRIINIHDVIGFHGESVLELETAFEEAVDNYLIACEKLGQKPTKTYS